MKFMLNNELVDTDNCKPVDLEGYVRQAMQTVCDDIASRFTADDLEWIEGGIE